MERELKGSADAVAAIEALRKRHIDLEVLAFGRVDPANFGLSPPYEFHFDPPQSKLVELYNRAAIYVAASHIEGWGLTLAEAAACGADLIASDIGGHRELAIEGRNARLFTPKDVAGLADAISDLVQNPLERIRLSEQSWWDVQVFDWMTASDRLESLLTHGIGDAEPLHAREMIEARPPRHSASP
jgi:glycosyltransferase involved in cell wall biosynthesis